MSESLWQTRLSESQPTRYTRDTKIHIRITTFTTKAYYYDHERASARSALVFKICSHQCKQRGIRGIRGTQAPEIAQRINQERRAQRERDRPENSPESGPVLTGRNRRRSLSGAGRGKARRASTGRAASTSSWPQPAPRRRRRRGCSGATARPPPSRPSW